MIKKWLIKLSQFSNTRKLLLCFTISLLIFVIAALLHLDAIAVITGFTSIALTIILFLAFMMRFSKDEPPIPLTDFSKVEGIEKYEKGKLYQLYMDESGRCVSFMMYEMMTPSEQQYVDWLELQATKLQILKENSTSL